MRKKVFSVLLVFAVLFSLFAIPASAADGTVLYITCPSCNFRQPYYRGNHCAQCNHQLPDFFEGGSTRGGGGRKDDTSYNYVDTPTKYYTGVPVGGSGGSGGTSGNSTNYTTGATTYTSIINTNNQTINIPTTTYNNTTNNYYNQYTYETITYNTTTNNYYTTINNTTYEITYAPQYTTIVYYSEDTPDDKTTQNFYYELPDGRNSADLKEDEALGIVTAYNVTNYTRVQDDNETQLLVHFDGDLKDSSAYQNQYSLSLGALNTYGNVDDTFGKAVYFDNANKRKLSYTLPSEIGTGDYTLEFRILFDSLALGTDVDEKLTSSYGGIENCSIFNSLSLAERYTYVYDKGSILYPLSRDYVGRSFGSCNGFSFGERSVFSFVGLLSWDTLYNSLSFTWTFPKGFMIGSNIEDCKESTSEYNININTWYNMAFVRENGVLCFYLDGIKIKTLSNIDDLINVFSILDSLNAGATYYLDELRLCSKALYTSDFYEVSSQPFDTNNILALPSSVLNDTIVVKNDTPITYYRIGGARPSLPEKGACYVMLDSSYVVQDVQVYTGSAWVSCDARISDSDTWVEIVGYNIKEQLTGTEDNSGGGSGGDDSGGDSGGSSGTGIWDKLGTAILGFFDTVGDVVGSIFTGLVNLLTSVVGSLANVVNLSTEFGSMVGTLYTWLPQPFQDLIIAAFGVALVICLFKLFT